MGKLMKITQAAKMLGVSAATLREWDKREVFKPTVTYASGIRMYSIDDIELFVETNSVGNVSSVSKPVLFYLSEDSYNSQMVNRIKRFAEAKGYVNYIFRVGDVQSGSGLSKLAQTVLDICNNQFSVNFIFNEDNLGTQGQSALIKELIKCKGNKLVFLEPLLIEAGL